MPFPLPDYGYHSVFKKFSGIDLRQTSLCPNNCVMCAKAQKGHARDTMSWDDLHFVLELFPDFDGVVSILGSGEVFMLADLPQRVEAIKKAWPRCTLYTNTTFNIYRGDRWIEELFKAGLDTIKISCYGFNEEDYYKIHGHNGWNGLVKNLRAVGKLPPEYGAKLFMLSFKGMDKLFGIESYAKKMSAFEEFVAENNINNFQTNHILPWHVPHPPNGDALWELPSPCTVVWAGNNPGWIYILENLDVVPCCMFLEKDYVFGNLRQNSIDEIFNGEKYKYFQETWRSMQPEKLPVCNTCQVYESYASPRELGRMAAWQARELAGQQVIFWGGEKHTGPTGVFSAIADRLQCCWMSQGI